jgi:hypothetical protein
MKFNLRLTRRDKDRFRILSFALLLIGIIIEIVSFANPAPFNGTSYDTSTSTAVANASGWLNLNATKSVNAGDNVNGTVTLQNYPSNNFQYGNTPNIYVLSPDEYGTWASTYPIGTPKSGLTAQTRFVYDFSTKTGWLFFSFKALSSTFYRFLVSSPNGYYSGTQNAALSLSVSSQSLLWWIRPLGILFSVPASAYVLPPRKKSKSN